VKAEQLLALRAASAFAYTAAMRLSVSLSLFLAHPGAESQTEECGRPAHRIALRTRSARRPQIALSRLCQLLRGTAPWRSRSLGKKFASVFSGLLVQARCHPLLWL
jgi:hypothetical protein